jgi:hypothetical protein
MDEALRPTLNWALRLLLALALLALPATPVSPALVKSMLPAARAWLGFLEPAFVVRSLTVERSGGRDRLRLEVSLAEPVRVGNTVVKPHPRGRARAEVPLAQVWVAPLLMVLVLLAWPARGWIEWALRAALALPAGVVLVAADAPVVLLAEIWKLLRHAHGEAAFHGLVASAELLRAGGRFGIGLVAAAALVMLVRRLMPARA